MSYKHLEEHDLKAIEKSLLTPKQLQDLVNLYKLFGDSTRLNILLALMNRELCVHDISEVVNVSQSAVSHQLRNLREAKLVKSRRSGKEVIYSLDDHHIEEIFKIGLTHILEEDEK
ncbi:MAG: helix-turn-helix transcriptional regulator [Erysipelothrix sp.]|nr:helix-turn-helix transcriptional regulator [Erysipelothrix sp.]